MAKDYAHHSRNQQKDWDSKKQQKKGPPKRFPWIAILFFLILLGGLIFSVVFVLKHKHAGQNNSVVSQTVASGAVVVDAKAIDLTAPQKNNANKNTQIINQPVNSGQEDKAAPLKKVKFDFYTMLPKMTVSIAEPSEILSGNSGNTQTNDYYLLQLMSTTSESEAKAFQSHLKLQGFTTKINPLTRAGKTWYRIQMGPYMDYQTAQNAQASMQEQQINGVILHIHAKSP